MKKLFFLLAFASMALGAQAADPLRVFIRGGADNGGHKGAHDHPRFLAEWKPLLAERGMKVDGAADWPNAEQIKNTDVIVAYAQEGGNATPEQEKLVEEFVKRGGGLVVIHTAAVSRLDPAWWKEMTGGAWINGKTKWREGMMDLYYTENEFIGDSGHPITKGASNFRFDDEIYYDMELKPDIRVLATSYTPNVKPGARPAAGGKPHIYDIQPQMWVYEHTLPGGTQPARAFVSIPGHLYTTFERPNYRAILMRGIAWAGKRANIDEYCKPEELSSLRYPDGGPQKPEQTLANLEIHPDFKLTLVAAEPLITKPMNFDWAPDGSLWVAETPEYPNGRRGMLPQYRGKEWKDHGGIDPEPGKQVRPGLDKICRLVDTNGDGVMDKKEVFYEGLELVTGLVFYKDGVIVTQAPDILFLRDTDGDGKADKVEKLYGGLGTGDTHAVINNPRWGWDGWIYATHGYSGSNRVVNAKGEKQPALNSGVVRFKPDGSAIEQYSSKGGNTWGLEITGDNRVMWTQPTSGELLMQTVLPEYALSRGKVGKTASYKVVERSPKSYPLIPWDQLAYVQIDWVGSFTAAAGCVVYDGGSWPAEYNGNYFCTEPTINIIHHTKLTPEASSYIASKLPGREETEFIRSKDMWWRPIEVRVGPDGAVYVGDFYNQAVIHNDTRGPDHNNVNAAVRPDRDHYFGRIWRLDQKDAKKLTVPDLSKADAPTLAKALEHPNRVVRMTASRLLVEKNAGGAELEAVLQSANPEARIAAMWTLFGQGKTQKLYAPVTDSDASVRRNALNILELVLAKTQERRFNSATDGQITIDPKDLEKLLSDPDGQVRLAMLRALGGVKLNDGTVAGIIRAWSKFDDDFQRSAAIGALSVNGAAAIAAVLDSGDAALVPLAATFAQAIAEKNDTVGAAKLVATLAEKPASADALKRSILDTLGKSLKGAPEMTPELTAALAKLLGSGASGSVLPLAAQWDKAGSLKNEITRMTDALFTTLGDAKATEGERINAATSLIGLRSTDAKILPAVLGQLGNGTTTFQRALVVTLGETGDDVAGLGLAKAFSKLPPDVQAAAFDVIVRRAESALALLAEVKGGNASVGNIGPANVARLRTHPDPAVSKAATDMLDQLNPLAKQKKETIAKLTPIVEQPGDPVKGKAFFAACAICHKFGDQGVEVGPVLNGMGSHGAGELLAAIVDPNAEIDPSFVAWNIETKAGQFYTGVIARENPTSVTLRIQGGLEQEVKAADIKSKVNTGRSLMPEGLDGLGGETLRDIIAYMQSVDGGKFRTVDLREAYTADTRNGLYANRESRGDTLPFVKFGTLNVEGVPFVVTDPAKSATGKNVVVLKGGPGRSASAEMPQRVEARLGGFKANRLHFLGGVTGWGFGGEGEPSPVMKATVVYTDGQKEELTFQNGVEFADYGPRVDVPGSKSVSQLLRGHQVRYFAKQLKHGGAIDKLVLESFNTGAAPTTVAITAELADPNAKPLPTAADAPTKPAVKEFVPQFSDAVPQPPAKANGPRVLLVGGGSSHDFVKFFGAADKAILGPNVGWVDFTQNANGIVDILPNVDLLVWSANQPLSSGTRKALTDWVNAGKPLVLLHPGVWYNWSNFPAWNKEVCGGGARGHERFGEFEVKATNPEHPIMKGVPANFKITDELYHFEVDPSGSPVEVLATASNGSGKAFPQVFVVKHPKAKIAGITLGHDAKAHDLPAFQTLLKNAVAWVLAK